MNKFHFVSYDKLYLKNYLVMEVHPKSWLWEGFSVKLDGITNVYGSTKLFNCNRKAEEVLVAATDSNEKALENCFRIVRFDRADNLRGTAPTVELPGLTEFQSSFTVLAVHSIPKKDVNLICKFGDRNEIISLSEIVFRQLK